MSATYLPVRWVTILVVIERQAFLFALKPSSPCTSKFLACLLIRFLISRSRSIKFSERATSMSSQSLDAHGRPPDYLRNLYKHYQKLPRAALDLAPDVLDLSSHCFCCDESSAVKQIGQIFADAITSACNRIAVEDHADSNAVDGNAQIYEITAVPGKPCETSGTSNFCFCL